MVKWIAFLALAGAVMALALYIRLAPSSAEEWHHLPHGLQIDNERNGVIVQISPARFDDLQRLTEVIQKTPRSTLLFGKPEDEFVTFVVRSKWIGFPDYVTVALRKNTLIIYARARFGAYDWGVNEARVTEWLRAIGL